MKKLLCFNPLDRGNLYQIPYSGSSVLGFEDMEFQSPRSGKFVSDSRLVTQIGELWIAVSIP